MIAVYGTLRRGGSANGLMRGCTWRGLDYVRGTIYDFSSFPVLKLGGKKKVLVDVYILPEDERLREVVLTRLDKYEGYYPEAPDQSLYERVTTRTVAGDDVFIYEYKYLPAALEITSGDWLCHRTT